VDAGTGSTTCSTDARGGAYALSAKDTAFALASIVRGNATASLGGAALLRGNERDDLGGAAAAAGAASPARM
jgi:hypothetical protein